MLDGAKDDLEFRVQINNVMDHNLMYSTDSVQPSEPFLESQYLWVIAGVFLVVIGIGIENRRRNKAKQILKQLVAENMWN